MAKEWILNSAMNRFQLNFKRNVGPTSESIRKCTPKTVEEWRECHAFTDEGSEQQLGLHDHGCSGMESKGMARSIDAKPHSRLADCADGIPSILKHIHTHSVSNNPYGSQACIPGIGVQEGVEVPIPRFRENPQTST